MGRKEKREFVKKAQKHGMDRKLAKAYVEIASGTGDHTEPQRIEEGDRVLINIEAVKARKNYKQMSSMYKEFIETASGKIFTAHIERINLISLNEEPKWLFWSGDLIKVKGGETKVDDVEKTK